YVCPKPLRFHNPHKHIAREQAVPRRLGDDADRHAIARIGPSEAVLHKDAAVLEIRHHAMVHQLPVLLAALAVDGAPPDLVFGRRLAHDELVVGREAGVVAGADHQGPEVPDNSFAEPDGLLVERGSAQVPKFALKVAETVMFKAVGAAIFFSCHSIHSCGTSVPSSVRLDGVTPVRHAKTTPSLV